MTKSHFVQNFKLHDNTPFHYQGLQSIFFSKDHLSRNVASINYGGFTAYRKDSGKYELLLQIIIDVNTANLWESPRSYLFHHLGRDRWTLNDGTTIQDSPKKIAFYPSSFFGELPFLGPFIFLYM